MAKGLSELQKEILKIAHRNRGRISKWGDVKNYEVLIKVYKFPSHSPGPQIFNRQEIGINRYKSASVSVAKAFNRLAERGLAHRKYNHGIILTEKAPR
ncbi:MAG: hypothetical protein ACFFC7_32360 [Candidatus Hermodarchaeota archaeon]